MYELIYSHTAKKKLLKLPKEIQEKILKSLERIRIKPYSHIKRLVGAPVYSLRVGAYRVILDIKDGNLVILVVHIGHRKNVYK